MTMMKKVYGTVVPPIPMKEDTHKTLKEQIVQIAYCGFPRNVFYASTNDVIEKEIVATIDNGLRSCPEFTAKALALGRNEGFAKMPAQIGAAKISMYGYTELFRKYFNKLIRIPTDLFAMVTFMAAHNGGKTGGRNFKTTVGAWLDEKLTPFWASKYAGNNAGFSMKDIISVVHPKPTTKEKEALYGYVVGKKKIDLSDIPYLSAVERLDKMTEDEAVACIRAFKIPHEAVIGRMTKMTYKIWVALLETMPLMALLRNLNTMERQLGTYNMPYPQIEARFTADSIRAAKILPFRFLKAFNVASSQGLKDILRKAVEESAKNVPSIKGKTVVAIDMSSSMSGELIQTAGFIGYAIKRNNEENAKMVGFAGKAFEISYSKYDSLLTQANSLFPNGWTNTSSVMQYVGPDTDNLIIITDGNENGNVRIQELISKYRRYSKLKVFVIDISPYANVAHMLTPHADTFYVAGMNDEAIRFVSYAAEGFGSLVDRVEGSTL